jgi:hypothetical protein
MKTLTAMKVMIAVTADNPAQSTQALVTRQGV